MVSFGLETIGNNVEEPLIYTSKGNLPIANLQYRQGWFESESEISFVEEYWLGEEIVKRSVHTKLKRGLDSTIEQAIFN
jgi:hypothetical protein